MQKVYKR